MERAPGRVRAGPCKSRPEAVRGEAYAWANLQCRRRSCTTSVAWTCALSGWADRFGQLYSTLWNAHRAVSVLDLARAGPRLSAVKPMLGRTSSAGGVPVRPLWLGLVLSLDGLTDSANF